MSWNVNGIRACLRNGFLDVLKKYQPDILALQEVKIAEKDRFDAKLDFPGYTEFWNSAERPGYAGTAILIKDTTIAFLFSKRGPSGANPQRENKKDIAVINGLGLDKFDSEGRVQTIEFEKFYFVNAYFPNTRHDLSRLDFKIEFNNKIFKHIKNLEQTPSASSGQVKPVIFTGDFNVAHTEIDLANPKENEKNAGFTIEERTSFDKFLKNKMIDTFRELHPKDIKYTWWTYRFGARRRNIGWRIDYFVISKLLKKYLKDATIMDQVVGSDHCPIMIKINL